MREMFIFLQQEETREFRKEKTGRELGEQILSERETSTL